MGLVFRNGTNRLWGAIVLAYVAAAIAVDGYLLVTNRGPFRWLSDAGIDRFKVRFLTCLVLLVASIGLLLAVKTLLERLTGRRLAPPIVEPSRHR